MACPGGDSQRQEDNSRYFVRTGGLFLVRCCGVETLVDEGRNCTLVVFEIVRPTRRDGGDAVSGFEGVNVFELPVGYCPSGPLELTEHPGGPLALKASDYSVGEPLHGTVIVFVWLYDSVTDAQPFIGRVFSLKETSGEGGIRSFRNL